MRYKHYCFPLKIEVVKEYANFGLNLIVIFFIVPIFVVMESPYLVGITGGSGSGKTYILNKMVEGLGENNICMISQDNYYRDRAVQPRDENGVENFDMPESIDLEQFAIDLKKLKQGHPVTRQEYTFNNKSAVAKELVFHPKPVIIVEGIFILFHKKVREMLDLKVYIDVKDYIKLKRRIIRDQIERGYDLDDVLYRYEKHVMPTYERYIKTHKEDADIVINNHKESGADKALEVLMCFLKTKVAHTV